ncbi:MAG: glycosyltransferase family 2 protein [Anaerolineae bacterium]|nr:glycosyltransferase family 2 protein [Anaerolineae bacterium]
MTTAPQTLTIVVPAYNEENGIDDVLIELNSLRQRLADQAWTVEIVVVDDGSTDRTAAKVRQHDHITLLEHNHNRGYGAALKTGIQHSDSYWICITDADGTYPNERIPDLLTHALETHSDMVVGVRTGEHVKIPLVRRPAKWFIRQLAIFVAGDFIPDLNSGLRLFQRDVARRFFDILPDGFSFTTTITLGMLVNGYLVKYLPINYHARVGRSKIRPVQDTLNFMQLVLRIALFFKPLKIFLPFSGLLVVLAVVWALFSKLVLGQLADVSTLVIMMTAVQVLVVGMLAELINQRMPNSYRE